MRKKELVFLPHGAVELRTSSDGKAWRTDWSSDSDADAAEELGHDVFSAEDDADDVLDYLESIDVLVDDEEVNVYEEFLDDDGDEGDDDETE